MATFKDGPAQGQKLMLKRAPIFLRVVEKDGKFDALDQLSDRPEPGEKIYAYKIIGEPTAVHLYFGGGRGGWYAMAEYGFCKTQPTDSEMRTNEGWRKWCMENIHHQ